MYVTAIDIIRPREIDLVKLNRKSIQHINSLRLSSDFASWRKPTVKRAMRYELY